VLLCAHTSKVEPAVWQDIISVCVKGVLAIKLKLICMSICVALIVNMVAFCAMEITCCLNFFPGFL